MRIWIKRLGLGAAICGFGAGVQAFENISDSMNVSLGSCNILGSIQTEGSNVGAYVAVTGGTIFSISGGSYWENNRIDTMFEAI